MTAPRRYTFKLYPNAAQGEALERQRRLHCDLYNALLQERIDCYRLCVDKLTGKGKTLTYYDQCKGLTQVRADWPEYAAMASNSMAATAQRVDRAFQAFFRRAKAGMGAQSGFPRYKGWRRFPGFSFKAHGTGWNLAWRDQGARPQHGSCYFKGVPGRVRFRGRLPARPEKIRTCELLWRDDVWWLSLVVDMTPRHVRGAETGEVVFDLVDCFAVVKTADGGHPAGSSETVYAAAEGRIYPVYRGGCEEAPPEPPETRGDGGFVLGQLEPDAPPEPPETRGDGGQVSVEVALAVPPEPPETRGDGGMYDRRKRRLESATARRRREALHLWTTALARRFGDLTIRAPASIREVSASGRGDRREPGALVDLKADFNRRLLAMAPASAVQMLEYKIAEAGGTVRRIDIDTARVGNDVVETAKAVKRTRRVIRRAARKQQEESTHA